MAHEGQPDDHDRAAIIAALDAIISPLLARDAAAVELVRVGDGVLTLRAKGSLRGCPGSAWTARGVILPVVRTVDASIQEVRFT